MTEYKLVVVGGGGVGKTWLAIQLTHNHCSLYQVYGEYDPTIEDSFHKMMTIDDETCLLDVLDTHVGQQQEFSALRDHYMRSAVGFVCAYSITSRTSFDEMDSFYEQILRVQDKDKVPMVLVGNKCDLREERQVSAEEGQNLAQSFDCPFFETSAKARINVEEAFFELIREVRKEGGLACRSKEEKCLFSLLNDHSGDALSTIWRRE